MATGKVIDGEAVLINVVTGRYYSLCDAGCTAWLVLGSGGSVLEAQTAIAERYELGGAPLRDDLAVLVEELLDEQLVIELGPGAEPEQADGPGLGPPADPLPPYTTVRLQTFKDMEDLLAFDPPLPMADDQFSQLPGY
jgi:hypothetical protein